VDDIQIECPELIRQNTFNDSDSLFSNDSGDTDLPNALCSDSQYFYNDSESTGNDLSQLMDLPLGVISQCSLITNLYFMAYFALLNK
jgi:hypothetical protein